MDETLGQLLVSENFQNIEEIAQCKSEDISKIDGIDRSLQMSLYQGQRNVWKKKKRKFQKN